MFPLQQPAGQEVASQTHCPVVFLHSCPLAQAAHEAPEVPHEPFDSEAYASQVPLEPPTQHPFGHVVASHEQTPVVVSQRPLAQAVHAAPLLPHCPGDSDVKGTQLEPLQQPFAHEVALQTHFPAALHSWPDAQAPHAAPPVPHEALDSEA